MLNFMYSLYRFLFARKVFYKFNLLVLNFGLRGLGIRNYESDLVSGEASFLKNYFRENDTGVVLDVGANIGRYSKMIANVSPNIKIFAFEPHPATFRKLEGNISGFNIYPVNSGVGCLPGILKLYDYYEDDGSSHASLYKDVIEKIHNANSTAHEVSIVTLDQFAGEHNIDRVRLLKIDTEGNELNVLKGFRSYLILNKIDMIHFEFNEMNVISKTFFKDFMEILPNYNFFRLLPNELMPIESYHPLYCEMFTYQNIVAILKLEYCVTQ